MRLLRTAISVVMIVGGVGLAVGGWQRAAAAGGAVTVGPDTQFHDSANANSSQTTISAGESIVFTWTGGLQHSVTADDGSFDSGVQTSGTFSQTFTTPGTYHYYCSIHGAAGGIGMSGVITVLAASTPTSTATQAATAATSTSAATPTATNTPGPTTTAASTGTTAAATSTPAGTVATVAPPGPSTPAGSVSAGGSLPSTGDGGDGHGRSAWLLWAGAALGVAGAGGLLVGLRKVRVRSEE